ncbi:glycosyltransferase [Celeribacter baekdonensis]|uniref:glycosyltransferase n=1 Tax=Celeribacter baekdonensis TaxID=875171 RepID=UPI003A927B1C
MKVGIVLGLHDSPAWIADQIRSIQDQSYPDWVMVIRDDGPWTETSDLAHSTAQSDPRLSYRRAEPAGFVVNFLMGLRDLPPDCDAGAFSDQDDIWNRDKLARAVSALRGFGDQPALYCARRHLLTESGIAGETQLYKRLPSFANALIENIAPGNTIVLNCAALDLARTTAPLASDVFAHDWWLYQLITGVGGIVIYDPEPVVQYRQHSQNILGAGEHGLTWLTNKMAVTKGLYRARIDQQTAALHAVYDRLTPENQTLLDRFCTARRAKGPLSRLRAMTRLPVRRQGALSHLTFLAAVACDYA